jgi:hypothetical protein
MKYRTLALVVFLAAAGCGGGSTEPTSLPQIGGNWTGHLQSANWPAAPIVVTLTQTDSSVTGTWTSATFDWNGTFNGSVTKTTFSGTATLSGPTESGVGRCTGNATFSGPVSMGTPTLVLTSAGFTSACGNPPSGLTWNLQR